MFLLADTTPAFLGNTIMALAALGGVAGVASYFATRREVEDLKSRVGVLENDIKDGLKEVTRSIEARNTAGEERASEIHKRIDPIAAAAGEIKGQLFAFTESFRNFTEIINKQQKGNQ